MESIRLLGLNIISSTLKYSDRFLSIKPANQVFYGALGVTAAASLSYGLMARSETAIDDPSNSEEGKLSKKASKNCSSFDIESGTNERDVCVRPLLFQSWQDMKEGNVTEPKTKLKFPLIICQDEKSDKGKDGCQVLTGIGIRSKNIINLKSIKIYAFGFYVCPSRLRQVLGEKYKGVSIQEIGDSDSFFDDLLTNDLDMTVRLVVYYKSLKMDMVRNAFESSLKNRLKKITGSDEDPGLKTFSGYFNQPMKLPRGSIIDFKWKPGGILITKIAGKEMEPIQSPQFCQAFFDMYIGDPPVSEGAKKQIGETFARLLSC